MIVSWNWLKEYVRLDMPQEELEMRLMMAGLNHEGTERIGDDLAIDLEVTSNRPDCLGHIGVAREVAVLWDQELTIPAAAVAESKTPVADLASVTIECPGLCNRYTARVVRGVKVAPSPDWLAERLRSLGIAVINNIVDITNFVLLDLGQPLHSFDVERLRGGRIRVRMAEPGEKMHLLDGNEIELDPEDVLIADGEGPVALAGVMGGGGSQIHDGTVSIFLESANFSATSVRRSSLRHGRTDSSARFEKSLDPHQARIGILRAAALVLELCPGAEIHRLEISL